MSTPQAGPPPRHRPTWAGRATTALRGLLPLTGSLTPNVRRLLLAVLLNATGLGAVGVVFNLYLVNLHYGLAIIGLVTAVSTVGTAGASLVITPLLRYRTARDVMLAGTALTVVALLAMIVLTSVPALVVLNLVSGAGLALATNLVGLLLMEEGTPEQQAGLFSTYFAIATGGSTIGALLSSLVSALAAPLRLPGGGEGILAHRLVLVAGCLVAAIALPPLARLQPARPSQERSGQGVHRTVRPERPYPGRDLGVILVAVGFVAASLSLSYPFLNVYFVQAAHATTSQVGVIFSVAAAIPTLTTFAGPVLVARFGKLQTFAATRVLSAPCLLLLAWHLPLALAASCVVGRNVLGSISGALDNNYMLEVLPPWLRARATGWRVATFSAVSAVATYGAGLLVSAVGYSPLFVAAAVLTVLAMIIYYGYFRYLPTGPVGTLSSAQEDLHSP